MESITKIINKKYPEILVAVNKEFSTFTNIDQNFIYEMLFITDAIERIALINIVNGKIECLNEKRILYPNKKLPGILEFLRSVNEIYPLPNVKFALNLIDEPRVFPLEDFSSLITIPSGNDYVQWINKTGKCLASIKHPAIFSPMPHCVFHKQLPIFSVCKISGIHSDILFPALGIYLFGKNKNFDNRNFYNKENKIFWRGSLTGGRITINNWKDFPRSQLCLNTLKYKYCDIGITSITQAPKNELPQIINSITKTGICKSLVPFEHNYNYKYLFDIEGNTYSSRLKHFLSSNSITIKSPFIWSEYYHQWLIPWKHYVPISSDQSDITNIFSWLNLNTESVLQIVSNANAFATKYFSFDFVASYIYFLLSKYKELSI